MIEIKYPTYSALVAHLSEEYLKEHKNTNTLYKAIQIIFYCIEHGWYVPECSIDEIDGEITFIWNKGGNKSVTKIDAEGNAQTINYEGDKEIARANFNDWL